MTLETEGRDLRRELINAMRRCTPKQRKWLYVVRQMAGQKWKACNQLGYSTDTVYRWVREDRIQKILALHAEIAEIDSELNAERIMREYGRLAFSNLKDFHNEDGTLKPFREWTEDMAAAVQEVRFDESGGVIELKLHGKPRPLDTTAKIRGVLVERHKHELTGPNGGPLIVQDATRLTDEQLEAIASRGSPALAGPPTRKN